MPVAVFDIDGTLTDTNDVDVECYEAAILAELGLEIPGDWPTFDEVTDAAILATACHRTGRPVPEQEIQDRIANRVAELLEAALAADPDRFRAIPGAEGIFRVLRHAGWGVAMATGAWRPSALVKLRAAGVPLEDVPLASSSDHWSRAEIIRHAVKGFAGEEQGPFVYVGDGVWDGRASMSLGFSFVGVGNGIQGERLMKVGASAVVPDFSDPQLLMDRLGVLSRDRRS
jgi:phosphoglycolate phosphatase-like HAD superfamily hydrolase